MERPPAIGVRRSAFDRESLIENEVRTQFDGPAREGFGFRKSLVSPTMVGVFMEPSRSDEIRHVEWLREASDYLGAGRTDSAVLCYQQVLRAEPSNVDALIGLADALEQLGRNSDAISMLEEYFKAFPCSARARARLADAFQIQGDLARAIEEYLQAVALDDCLRAAWWGLGCAQALIGDHALAVKSFQRLLSLEPGNGKALLNLGKSLFELGQIDLAIHALRKSVEHLPAAMQRLSLANIAVVIPGSPVANNQDVFATGTLPSRSHWLEIGKLPPSSTRSGARCGISCAQPRSVLSAR